MAVMEGQLKQTPLYVLGHSGDEQQRLIIQSEFYRDLTEQVLRNAGIKEGMRVLDVGCGVGDVSFLLAKLVGLSGTVIGIDKSADAVATARLRAQAAELDNVTFLEGDIANIELEYPVDAAVGRFVLMYLSDPASTLRRIASRVGAGGVIAFQEMDLSGIRSFPRMPLFEHAVELLIETFRRGQVETQMGLKLHATFVEAGLRAPKLILGGRVEGGQHSPVYEIFTSVVRSALPMMERLGVAKPEEVQIETLAKRLREEVVQGRGILVPPPLIGAWARLI